jgi:hypothetical protein
MRIEMQASGVVAFFDILGYKAFLKHSQCDEAATLVVKTIAYAENAVVSHFEKTSDGEEEADEFMEHVRAVTWVVFSDTLLLLCPFKVSISEVDAVRRWHVVILSAQILSKHMFEVGLPLRGCISYGHFIHEKNCFAGKTILEAYEFAESLQVAATVIYPTAFEELRRAVEPFALQQNLTAKLMLMGSLVKYEVEMTSAMQQLHTLNFLIVKGITGVPSAWVGDCNEIVMRSYTQHNKTLGAKERAKADNTAAYLAFLESKFPGTLNQA